MSFEQPIENTEISNEREFQNREFHIEDLVIREKIDPEEEWDGRSFNQRIFLTLVNNERRTLDINSLLPEEWELSESTTQAAVWTSSERKRVILPKIMLLPKDETFPLAKTQTAEEIIEKDGKSYEVHPFLSLKGALLVVLHEIGHAASSDNQEQFARFWERVGDKEFKDLSDQEKSELADILIRSERDASAFALKKLRDYQKSGIDLSAGLTKEQILDILHPDNLKKYGFSEPQSSLFIKKYREGRKRSK